MAGSIKIILVALPVMGMSFYGTHKVMQELMPKPTSQIVASSVVSATSQNALLTGESIIAKTKSYKNNGNGTPSLKLTMASFKQGVGFKNNNFGKEIIVAKAENMPSPVLSTLSAEDVKIKPAKIAVQEQVIKSEAVQQIAEIKPVEVVVAAKLTPKAASVVQQLKAQQVAKPLKVAAATSSDPYIVDVAPKDVNNSILYQASIQKSWADALVTSAFKTYGPKGGVVKKKESSVQRAIAITPRILPSGRAFGGFTEGEFQKRELRCMATGLYFEARSEPIRGQLAVGQVIMNRVRSPDYPDTICGVIFQGDHRNTGCQFSFACDGKTDRPSNARLWKRSQKLAKDLTKGKVWLKDIANSTHYHADYVHPKWRRSMRRLKKIGRHIFYKSPNISTTDTFQSVRS